jgi:foldase protein PrsA
MGASNASPTCGACGKDLDPSARFCLYCGASVQKKVAKSASKEWRSQSSRNIVWWGLGGLVIFAILLGVAVIIRSQLSAPRIADAVAQYVSSLADGTFDGYLKHEGEYRNSVAAEKQALPSDMWPAREAALLDGAKARIRQDQQNAYGPNSDACYLIVREGALVKTKEIRPVGTDAGRAFYEISYADESKSPVITLQNGKQRFFRSGVFTVSFAKASTGEYVAQRDCLPVEGTFDTWPVPELSSNSAVQIANQGQLLPTQYVLRVNRIATVGELGAAQGWKEFVGGAQLLKATLEKHGWTASGFQPKSMYFFEIQGNIEPPASAQKWILGTVSLGGSSSNDGYRVALLDKGTSKVVSFSPQGDSATATFRTEFSGCTSFCTLWKDLHALPLNLGAAVFADLHELADPSLANLEGVSATTTVNFYWEPRRGWYVQHASSSSDVSSATGGGDVASVNGQKISRADFDKKLKAGSSGKSALTQLVQQVLVDQYATDKKIMVADDEIAKKEDEIKAKYPPGQFEQILKQQGLTEANVHDILRQTIEIEKAVDPQIKISDADVKAYFDKNHALLDKPEQVRARHILVADLKTANEVEAKLKSGGDFAALAKQYSTDPSTKDKGGELGFFGKGQMVPSFQAAAFSAPINTITPPVKSPFGYHVIQVEEKKPAVKATLPSVHDQIVAQLKQQQQSQQIPIFLQQLKSQAKIDVYDDNLKR